MKLHRAHFKNGQEKLQKGWEICNLEDYIKLIDYRGRTPVKTETGIRLITAKNVKLGYLQLEPQEFINPDYYNSWMTRGIPNFGDVIFTTEAPLANVAQLNTTEKVAFAQRIIVMQPQKSKIDQTFLKYLLLSDTVRNKILEKGTGATVQGIKSSLLKKIQLLLPSIPEQLSIVVILDEAFIAIAKAKANTEQNLKNVKGLFESYLQTVFTHKGKDWNKKTLEQISETFGRGKSKCRPRNDERLYGGEYPFIQTGDIRNCNHYITKFSQTYNEVGLAQSKLWPKGTICITIAANIAETGVLTFDACFPDSVIGLVVNEKLADRNFVEYLLQSFKSRLQALSKGSAQANINMGTFENELFPFPPVKEQKSIVLKLDALSNECKKLKYIYQQKLINLEELKKSVLQKGFAGELN